MAFSSLLVGLPCAVCTCRTLCFLSKVDLSSGPLSTVSGIYLQVQRAQNITRIGCQSFGSCFYMSPNHLFLRLEACVAGFGV